MKKILTVQTVTIVALLGAITFLGYMNYQMSVQSSKLASEVATLTAKLEQIDSSATQIKQRMAKLEQKLEPKFQDLLAMN
ncbi:hypothetical protein [Thalassotalea ganghwensis]